MTLTWLFTFIVCPLTIFAVLSLFTLYTARLDQREREAERDHAVRKRMSNG